MRKNVALMVVLFFLATICLTAYLPVKAESKTITVPDDFATIQEAINAADAGDTIFVKRGTYVENPVVNKSVCLVGEDRDATVIDVTAGLKVEKGNVTVAGLTIFDGFNGISVDANNCNISGNKIKQATHGIVVFGNNNQVTGNSFESIGLSSAIQLNFANKNIIKNNYIESCVEGIQIWQNSNNNTITENTITNCQDTAISFQYSNHNVIVGNNISLSGLGTSIYGSNNNSIYNNNYINNTVQFSAQEDYYLSFGNNRSVNIINENYWSDYEGTDSNGDGVGDSPYVIDEYNQDNHPLTNPAQILPPPIQSTHPSSKPTPSTPIPTVKGVSDGYDPRFIIIIAVAIVVVIGVLIYSRKKSKTVNV